jgi:hypothetical protein
LRDGKDGSVSSAHAEQILQFLSGTNGGRARQIIALAKTLSARISDSQLQRHVPDSNIQERISESRRVNFGIEHDDLGLETAARQLRWWLLRVAPERDIHNRALDKALQALPNRAVYGIKA